MFSSQLAGLDGAMEVTKVIALLLTGWTLLGLSKGLRCYCNTTASIVVNVNCLNIKSCETDYMCAAHRFYSDSDQRYVTVWECLTSVLNRIRIEFQAQDSCSGDLNTNTTSYKCCNDSEDCNRALDVTVPDEMTTTDEEPTSELTPSPSPTTMPIRRKCYCNSTGGLAPQACIANSFTCETESACVTQRYVNEMNREVMSWNCLEQLADMFLPSSVLCQTSNTQNAIRCCNSSDYCNRGLRPRLVTEPTTDPQTTGTEVLVNQPAGTPDSLLYVWLTVGVVGLAFIVAAVVLGVCVGVMVRYYHAKQKVTLSHDQFNPVVVPHDQFKPLTCRTMA